MSKCAIKIDKNNGQAKVTVSGVIDEDVSFQPYPLAGLTKIDFFLGELKGINSCGIREWINWIRTASQATIAYHECPKVIVNQINMVHDFLPPNAKVISFYVPYFNEETEEEKQVLFRDGKEFAQDGSIPVPATIQNEKGAALALDVVEAKYFKFLAKK